jgi:cysteine desulfurase
MNYLEARDIYVSKSSACKKGGRSHVLESIGLDSRIIDGALRVGLSRFTSEADTEAFADAVIEASASLAHR